MKKLILLIGIVLALQSCKKCGTCYYTYTITPEKPENGYPKVTEYSEDACGDDYKEMRKFDDDKTYDVTTITGAPAKLVVHQTKCQ